MSTAEPIRPDDLLTHAAALRRLACALLEDRGLAEDVVQDAFVTALESPPRQGGAFRSWLRTVVRRKALDTQTAGRRRKQREHVVARSEAEDVPSSTASTLATRRDVVDAVAALPEPYRTTICQRYFEDLSPRDIAAREHVPVKTIKTRLWRGLEMLRRRFDVKHGDRSTWTLALLPVTAGSRTAPVTAAAVSPAIGVIAMKTPMLIVGGGLVLVGLLVLFTSSGGTGGTEDAPSPTRVASSAHSRQPSESQPASGSEPGAIATRPFLRRDPAPLAAAHAPAEPRRLHIQVVRATDGAPVVDAAISLSRPFGRARPLRTARTDRTGCVTFEPAPNGAVVVSLALTTALRHLDLDALDLSETVMIQVSRGVHVRGLVTDDRGKAVAGAHVMAYSVGIGPRSVARSDEDGRFSLHHVQKGITLAARHDDFGPSRVHPVTVEPGEKTTIHLQLARSSRCIQGVVLEPNGRPAASAMVVIVEKDRIGFLSHEVHTRAATTVTNARGEFRMRIRPSGPKPLLAIAIPRDRNAFAPTSTAVPPATTEPGVVDLELRTGAVVEGRVRSRDAIEPGATAQVWTEKPEDAFANIGNVLGLRVVPVEADGSFRIAGLPRGLTRLYVKDARGRALGESTCTLRDDQTHRWVVDVNPDHKLRARVSPPHPPLASERGTSWRADLIRIEGNRSTYVCSRPVSPADGSVEFWNVPPTGAHALRIRLDVRRRAGERVDVGVTSTDALVVGGPIHEIEIPTKQLPTASVRGRLVDGTGRPVPKKSLTLLRAPDSPREAVSYAHVRTDDEGRFTVTSLVQGKWRVTLTADNARVLTTTPWLTADADHDCGDTVLE